MMTISRSLSNYTPKSKDMQVQTNRIEHYLQKKFRISHSFDTRNAYLTALKKFTEFLRIKHNYSLDLTPYTVSFQLISYHRPLKRSERDKVEIKDRNEV